MLFFILVKDKKSLLFVETIMSLVPSLFMSIKWATEGVTEMDRSVVYRKNCIFFINVRVYKGEKRIPDYKGSD